MPMKPEEHEEILNTLLNPELEQSQRTELLGKLRADYGSVITDHRAMSDEVGKLSKEKEDLLITNSQLFRERGVAQYPKEDQKKLEEKERAESIKVDDIIKQLGGA